ncbi:MAG: enoyl-CoA hydratase/isomerase family protein [Acidimicrobiales bacterium]
MSDLSAIRVEIVALEEDRGLLARVVLDRPEARNALNLTMCVELRRAFEELDARDDVRAVLVSGDGPAFCAGADFRERDGRNASWVRSRRLASFAAYRAIELCRKPVVATVHGAVVGSGGEIALSCDFAVAAEQTTFRFPEAHWGTVGATQRLQRAIGKRKAKEIIFTNRAVGASEAERLGLVARVVPQAELHSSGLEIARSIAGAPALAMALTKRSIDLGSEGDLDHGIRVEMTAVEHLLTEASSIETFTRLVSEARRSTDED